jgi:hypothetical protein
MPTGGWPPEAQQDSAAQLGPASLPDDASSVLGLGGGASGGMPDVGSGLGGGQPDLAATLARRKLGNPSNPRPQSFGPQSRFQEFKQSFPKLATDESVLIDGEHVRECTGGLSLAVSAGPFTRLEMRSAGNLRGTFSMQPKSGGKAALLFVL